MKRLSEPAEDTPTYASGGYTGTGTKFAEPDAGCYVPGNRVELTSRAAQLIREASQKSVHLGKYNSR